MASITVSDSINPALPTAERGGGATSSRNGIREDCSPLWPVSDGPHRALDFTDTDLFWFVFAVFSS